MPKTATKKKKSHLDNNTKYMGIAIALGGAVLVLAIVLPIVIIFSKNRPSDDPPDNLVKRIPNLEKMINQTNELENAPFLNDKEWWKWDKLQAKRFAPKDENLNGAYSLEKKSLYFPNDKDHKGFYDDLKKALPTQLPNVRLTPVQTQDLGQKLDPWVNLVAAIHNLPAQGGFPLELLKPIEKTDAKNTKYTAYVPRHPYEISKSHLELVSKAVILVLADGVLKLDRNDTAGALQAYNTLHKLAGYLRGEPFSESQLSRIEVQMAELDLLERILGHTPQIPDPDLKDIQHKLFVDCEYSELGEAIRFERGAFDKLCEMSRAKAEGLYGFPTAPYKTLAIGPEEKAQSGSGGPTMPGAPGGPGGPGPGGPGVGGGPTPGGPGGPGGASPGSPMPGGPGMGGPGMPGMGGGGEVSGDDVPLDKAQAWFLQYTNEVMRLAKAPTTGFVSGVKKWNQDSPRTPSMAKGFVPEFDVWTEQYLIKLARMRCAFAAVATERYRLHYNGGAWPKSLAELNRLEFPEEKASAENQKIMSFVPVDPFTDRAILYQTGKKNEGYALYSLGVEKVNNQGQFDTLNTEKSSIGFRLWLPQLRGQ